MPALLIGNMIEMVGHTRPTPIHRNRFSWWSRRLHRPNSPGSPRRHLPMERGIRPIAHSGDVTVRHRIPMDGIDMAVEIVGVADLMLPKPPLPNRTFPVFFLGRVHPFLSME